MSFREVDGGTGATTSFEAQPLTLVAKLTRFLMRPMMKTLVDTCARDLEDLEQSIESGRES